MSFVSKNVQFRFCWNQSVGNENNTCVAMQTNLPIGLWQNLDCDANKYFVCEYWRRGYTSPSTTTIGPSTSPIPCPAGWTGFESNCYKVSYVYNVHCQLVQRKQYDIV